MSQATIKKKIFSSPHFFFLTQAKASTANAFCLGNPNLPHIKCINININSNNANISKKNHGKCFSTSNPSEPSPSPSASASPSKPSEPQPQPQSQSQSQPSNPFESLKQEQTETFKLVNGKIRLIAKTKRNQLFSLRSEDDKANYEFMKPRLLQDPTPEDEIEKEAVSRLIRQQKSELEIMKDYGELPYLEDGHETPLLKKIHETIDQYDGLEDREKRDLGPPLELIAEITELAKEGYPFSAREIASIKSLPQVPPDRFNGLIVNRDQINVSAIGTPQKGDSPFNFTTINEKLKTGLDDFTQTLVDKWNPDPSDPTPRNISDRYYADKLTREDYQKLSPDERWDYLYHIAEQNTNLLDPEQYSITDENDDEDIIDYENPEFPQDTFLGTVLDVPEVKEMLDQENYENEKELEQFMSPRERMEKELAKIEDEKLKSKGMIRDEYGQIKIVNEQLYYESLGREKFRIQKLLDKLAFHTSIDNLLSPINTVMTEKEREVLVNQASIEEQEALEEAQEEIEAANNHNATQERWVNFKAKWNQAFYAKSQALRGETNIKFLTDEYIKVGSHEDQPTESEVSDEVNHQGLVDDLEKNDEENDIDLDEVESENQVDDLNEEEEDQEEEVNPYGLNSNKSDDKILEDRVYEKGTALPLRDYVHLYFKPWKDSEAPLFMTQADMDRLLRAQLFESTSADVLHALGRLAVRPSFVEIKKPDGTTEITSSLNHDVLQEHIQYAFDAIGNSEPEFNYPNHVILRNYFFEDTVKDYIKRIGSDGPTPETSDYERQLQDELDQESNFDKIEVPNPTKKILPEGDDIIESMLQQKPDEYVNHPPIPPPERFFPWRKGVKKQLPEVYQDKNVYPIDQQYSPLELEILKKYTYRSKFENDRVIYRRIFRDLLHYYRKRYYAEYLERKVASEVAFREKYNAMLAAKWARINRRSVIRAEKLVLRIAEARQNKIRKAKERAEALQKQENFLIDQAVKREPVLKFIVNEASAKWIIDPSTQITESIFTAHEVIPIGWWPGLKVTASSQHADKEVAQLLAYKKYRDMKKQTDAATMKYTNASRYDKLTYRQANKGKTDYKPYGEHPDAHHPLTYSKL